MTELEAMLDLFITHERLNQANKETILKLHKQEITELIDEIPNDAYIKTGLPEAGKMYIGNELKQQLRDKWL